MFRAHWKILFLLFQLAWLHVPSRLALSTLHQPLLLLSHGLRINSAHTPTCAKGPTVLELHPWEARRRCQRNSSKLDRYNMFELHRVLANTTASWNSRQTQGMLNGSCITYVSFQISCGSNLNVLSESCCLINHRLISQIMKCGSPKTSCKRWKVSKYRGKGSFFVGSSVMGQVHHMLRPNGHTRWRKWRLLSSCLTPKRNSDTCRNSGCQMDSGKEIWIDVHTLRWGKNLSTQTIYTNTFQLTSILYFHHFIVKQESFSSLDQLRTRRCLALTALCICFFLWIYF